ncbi:MAG: ABC transporter permease [Candidatus Aquicultorales bacterium]
MLSIARLTFREAVRKKIVLIAFVLTGIFIVLYGTGLYYVGPHLEQIPDGFGRQAVRSQFLTMGLFMASFIISVTAIFASVGSVSADVDSGIMHAVLARPIRRGCVVLGKYLGCAVMVGAFGTVLFLAVTTLANRFTGVVVENLPATLGLFILQPLILTAVSVAFSTTLSTLGSGIAAFTLYSIAFVGGFVEQLGAMIELETLVKSGIVASLVMPSDAIYRKAISLVSPATQSLMGMSSGPFGTVSAPSTWMVVYACFYLAGVLALGIRIFTKRDIG